MPRLKPPKFCPMCSNQVINRLKSAKFCKPCSHINARNLRRRNDNIKREIKIYEAFVDEIENKLLERISKRYL